MRKLFFYCMAALAALVLVACSDGGSTTTASTTITGSAVKGPVNGATVTIRNASTGAVLGTTTTSVTGAYSISVSFTGDVVIEISGGSYRDEATNVTTTLAAPMRTVLTTNGGSVVGMVTPLTTMAYTYSASGSAAPSAANFNTAATNLAAQFGLTNVNLVTTLPTVTDTSNAYGNALRALSQYLQNNTVSLNDLINQSMGTTTYATFNSAYSAAYSTINGQSITINFNGSNLVTISGTGAGGGSGTCGVAVSGSITANNMSVPININYCITGIAAPSCTSGNSSLNSALTGQQGLAGAVNLNYTFSPTCAAGAFTLAL